MVFGKETAGDKTVDSLNKSAPDRLNSLRGTSRKYQSVDLP